ncbi:MAG TPA: stress response translation initiation inhibitor YciH [Candidimonas sp.]|nr:stress response translation initiation inhibitor YciH [Candidimonas sp.]
MATIPKDKRSSALVYSTEVGRVCPGCERPVTLCMCGSKPDPVRTDGVVRVSLETKGRRGKGVTVIKGVPLASPLLEQFGKQLKMLCGSGGTTKDGVIEIQGDHRELAASQVAERGWKLRK